MAKFFASSVTNHVSSGSSKDAQLAFPKAGAFKCVPHAVVSDINGSYESKKHLLFTRFQAGASTSSDPFGYASGKWIPVASLASARAQARVSAQAEETAKQGLLLAKTRQQVGVGTQLEVRDAELKLTQAQLSHVNALLDGREQESALRRAVGG